MRQFLAGLAVAMAAAAIIVGCRQYLPTNRYLQMRRSPVTQSTADARGKFDHRLHASVFNDSNVTCIECHRFDVLIEASDPEMAKALSMQALRSGSEACHYCHRAGETKMAAASGACTACHENLAPLRPEDHDVGWSRVHAGLARAEPERCQTCHRQAECINCHQRRDSIQTIVHERNFRFFHSIEARANPMKCGSCHRQDYCIRCHQQGKVELQP